MAYPGSFHRLVIQGTLYDDIFNTTLAFVHAGGGSLAAVTQSLCNNVGAAVGDWWNDPLDDTGRGLTISGSAKFTGIKLNRINTAGRYQDPDTIQYLAPTPVVGGGSAGMVPQLSIVASLRGFDPRAKAGKGRMFFPVSQLCNGGLDVSGRISTANATQYAKGVRNLLGVLNDIYLTAGVTAVAGIASDVGAGAFQGVDAVRVGRVIDTMRSRRNKDLEDPVEVTM